MWFSWLLVCVRHRPDRYWPVWWQWHLTSETNIYHALAPFGLPLVISNIWVMFKVQFRWLLTSIRKGRFSKPWLPSFGFSSNHLLLMWCGKGFHNVCFKSESIYMISCLFLIHLWLKLLFCSCWAELPVCYFQFHCTEGLETLWIQCDILIFQQFMSMVGYMPT